MCGLEVLTYGHSPHSLRVFFDEDEDVIKAILPRYGRMTIFPGNIKHVGRGVSRICPTIRRVLVLKGKPRE